MCLFIESIKYKNGAFYRLDLHQMRVNLVFKLYFPEFEPFQLSEIPAFKLFKKEGIYKCRIVFDNNIKEISILPYERKNFESFQLVESDIDSLPYKRAERTELNNAFQQKENCSDIIVVKKDILLTVAMRICIVEWQKMGNSFQPADFWHPTTIFNY